jgi:hypothetical protein
VLRKALGRDMVAPHKEAEAVVGMDAGMDAGAAAENLRDLVGMSRCLVVTGERSRDED